MRWRSASLTACSGAVLVAGCGGGEEHLPKKTAARLSALAGLGPKLPERLSP